MLQARSKALASGLILAAFLLAAPLRAAEEGPQKYVVLIGISDYADKQIKPRPKAENDTKALFDLFTDKEYLGVERDHVRLLLGKEDEKRKSEPATRANILKAVNWLADNAKKNDLVIFSFSGEGAPLSAKPDDLGYLAVDTSLKDRAKTAVTALDIRNAFDKVKSHSFCMFIDVNFRGTDKAPVVLPEATLSRETFREFFGPSVKDEEGMSTGRAIYAATNCLEPSLNLEDHDLFASVVLQGLKGKADKEGYEPDGVVTADELAVYLENQIPELSRKLGKTKDEKSQQARVYLSPDSRFVLTHNPTVATQARTRLNALSSLAEEKKISAETAEEGRTLLSRMPRLKAQQDLRKLYQKLVDGTVTPEAFSKERAGLLAGMKIKRDKAGEYASKIIDATNRIKSSYVKETNQGELVNWALRGLYHYSEEKMPADIEKRLAKPKTLTQKELAAILTEARERLGLREDLDKHKDIDVSLQLMMRHLDPHTTYIDPDTVTHFRTETTGNFTGIGVQIQDGRRDESSEGYLKVVTPIFKSPAYEAGVKAGDEIVAIIREVDEKGASLKSPERTSTKGMTSGDAVKLIQGKAGTKLKLVIQRKDHEGPLEIEVKRSLVDVESVFGVKRTAKDTWDYFLDPVEKIAYIRVDSFARNTARDLARAMEQLEEKGLKGLILDLRENPGGLLPSAVEISWLFIDDGLIVTIRPRGEEPTPYIKDKRDPKGTYQKFPMVCLVDANSASGSEIVAACLQDHKRAVIMGERSYGKGSVQTIQPFEGGEIKLTTASFWRPNGKNLNKASTSGQDTDEWGVTPNKGFMLELSNRDRMKLRDHMKESESIVHDDEWAKKMQEFKDRQLGMALDYLKVQITKAPKTTPTKEPATKAADTTTSKK